MAWSSWRASRTATQLSGLTDAGVEVAVDYTHPGVVMDHVAWCIDHGVHVVVGTSGFTDERLAAIEEQLRSAPSGGRSRRAELLDRRCADDEVRRRGRAILRVGGDRRAAPSDQEGRSVGHVDPDRSAGRRGPVPGGPRARCPTPPWTTRSAPAVGPWTVYRSTASGRVAWSRTRRSSSATPGETLTIRHDMPDRVAAMPALVTAIKPAVMRANAASVLGLERVARLALRLTGLSRRLDARRRSPGHTGQGRSRHSAVTTATATTTRNGALSSSATNPAPTPTSRASMVSVLPVENAWTATSAPSSATGIRSAIRRTSGRSSTLSGTDSPASFSA